VPGQLLPEDNARDACQDPGDLQRLAPLRREVLQAALQHPAQVDHVTGVRRREAPHHDTAHAVAVFQHRLAVDERRGGDDPRHGGDLPLDASVVLHGARVLHENDVGVDPEDLVAQFLLEAVHDGQHDDEGRNPQEDACHGDEGDDGNEDLFPFGPEIPKADKKFVGHDGPECNPSLLLLARFMTLFKKEEGKRLRR